MTYPEHTETKPFFVTSEFLGTLAALVALAVTTASSDALDAGTAWLLATGIVAAFVFSRGFSKAGATSRSWDPRETRWWSRDGDGGGKRAHGASAEDDDVTAVASAASHHEEGTYRMSTVHRDEYETQRGPMAAPYGYGRGFGMRMGAPHPIETKPFFLTSEFWGSIALIIGLAIAAGTSDEIDAARFWTLATAITIGYVISRGIAKSGTKSRSWDPREDLMQGMRERTQQGERSYS